MPLVENRHARWGWPSLVRTERKQGIQNMESTQQLVAPTCSKHPSLLELIGPKRVAKPVIYHY